MNNVELLQLNKYVNERIAEGAFGETVYGLMFKHNLTAPQVYKNCMLRRQDFSRATNMQGGSNVSRHIAWQIIVGLHCSLDEADQVLLSAGYLRRKNRFDLIMEYFILTENYNIEQINSTLAKYLLKQFSLYQYSREDVCGMS